jgi:LytS/YehU family sensor histidine kinase
MPFGLHCAFLLSHWLFGLAMPDGAAGYRIGWVMSVLITGVFFLWRTRREARDAARVQELRAAAAEQQKLAAQLSALTAQMNPHLLFNALNTVAALIPSDPVRAEAVVLRLAELYRGVLAATHRTTHALADELRICEAYLEIEKARFGERLCTRVELPTDLALEDLEVPVLVLQPLVENAVTHGVAERSAGGSVSIRARAAGGRLELAVEDDGVGLGASRRKGAGIGVETTRHRLRLYYGDLAGLELAARPGGGTRAVLRLPIEAPAEVAA